MVLKGLKIIDVASYVAGPAAATVMGDFGADVIKIEPHGGDGYRSLAARHRTNYNWQLTSRNKRSIALDITTLSGQETLHALIDDADVLLLNFNADQMKKYQLEFDTLIKRNPRLIFAHLTGYGSRGPDAGRRAFDLAAWWARSGILDMMKPLGGAPVNGVGGVGDHASAMSMFAAVMMALYDREKTGKGAYVATSLAANGLWANGMHLQGAIAGFDLSEIIEETGFRSPFILPYKTRDNRYLVLVGPDAGREWPRLCRAFGRENWLGDDRFQDLGAIMKHRDELKLMFAEEIGRRNLHEVAASLDEAGATYSIVEKLKDVLQDAHLIENEFIVRTESDDPDYQWTISSPIEMRGTTKKTPSEAPGIGEHSRDILGEAGFDTEQIDKLIALGVVKE